jgi:hypothetical protein
MGRDTGKGVLHGNTMQAILNTLSHFITMRTSCAAIDRHGGAHEAKVFKSPVRE